MSKNYQIISPTKITPEVILDPKGSIKFTGRLISENADEFFNPIDEWVNKYFENPADITCIEICLEYINSAGTKYLLDLIKKITHIHLRNNNEKFIINWFYEEIDQDMVEKGTIFSLNLNVPINLIKISR